MPKKQNSEANRNLPTKAKQNDISISADPISNVAQSLKGAISSINDLGSTIIEGGASIINKREETKQIKIKGDLENKKVELQNKLEIIKGAFNLAIEISSNIDSYLGLLKEKEKTEVSKIELNKEREKTKQVESESNKEIEKSNNELKIFLAKCKNEEMNIEAENAKLLITLQTTIKFLMDEMKDTKEIIDELKKERGIDNPLTMSFIYRRREINDKLMEISEMIYKVKN